MEKRLPERIRGWINARGISDRIIQEYDIHFADGYIVIPVHDEHGNVLFNKYRRDPESESGPKYKNEQGSVMALYGVLSKKEEGPIVLCEGEFDCLVLRSNGFRAYTGTGGSSTFLPSWVSHFGEDRVHIVFDHDDPGMKGAFKVHAQIPGSLISWLPKQVGDHGDITDYFVKMHKTATDFSNLLLEGRAYVFPTDWKQYNKKKDLERTKKEYAETIGFIMADARAERAAYRSDRHLQILLEMYNTQYAAVSRAIKYFSAGRDSVNQDVLARAKAVPIPLFLKFPPNNTSKCLWHDEKTASLHYYPNQNRVYCFGGCGKYFDTLDVVQKLHGVGLKEAIKITLDTYGGK